MFLSPGPGYAPRQSRSSSQGNARMNTTAHLFHGFQVSESWLWMTSPGKRTGPSRLANDVVHHGSPVCARATDPPSAISTDRRKWPPSGPWSAYLVPNGPVSRANRRHACNRNFFCWVEKALLVVAFVVFVIRCIVYSLGSSVCIPTLVGNCIPLADYHESLRTDDFV